MGWYISVLKKYAEFSGRARRKEYWAFILFNCIITVVLLVLGRIGGIGIIFTIITGVYSLAVLCPVIAVTVRRLHDAGRPGLHFLFALIPLAGCILLLIWTVKEGTPGDNEYGSDPKWPGSQDV
ncbi:MAG: DUF805 domain-containing protein [Treponema sp.]|nr:DUF805 domain-containing protein [Treponema sp.]